MMSLLIEISGNDDRVFCLLNFDRFVYNVF